MAELFFDLDRSSPVPLYFQVVQHIQSAITKGDLAPGDRLENEISLAARLKLSRPTVRRAIQELVDKGLLVRKRGVGTQVVRGKLSRRVELTSLYDDLEHGARAPSTTLLINEVVPADDRVSDELGVALASPVLHLRRLRFAGGEPLAVMENYLPEDLIDIGQADLEQRGLYQLLRAHGVHLRVAQQSIGARAGTIEECKLLTERKGSPLLTMDRAAHDDYGRTVEWGHHVYRASLYSFEVTLVDH